MNRRDDAVAANCCKLGADIANVTVDRTIGDIGDRPLSPDLQRICDLVMNFALAALL